MLFVKWNLLLNITRSILTFNNCLKIATWVKLFRHKVATVDFVVCDTTNIILVYFDNLRNLWFHFKVITIRWDAFKTYFSTLAVSTLFHAWLFLTSFVFASIGWIDKFCRSKRLMPLFAVFIRTDLALPWISTFDVTGLARTPFLHLLTAIECTIPPFWSGYTLLRWINIFVLSNVFYSDWISYLISPSIENTSHQLSFPVLDCC